jgi:hypothetical protein
MTPKRTTGAVATLLFIGGAGFGQAQPRPQGGERPQGHAEPQHAQPQAQMQRAQQPQRGPEMQRPQQPQRGPEMQRPQQPQRGPEMQRPQQPQRGPEMQRPQQPQRGPEPGRAPQMRPEPAGRPQGPSFQRREPSPQAREGGRPGGPSARSYPVQQRPQPQARAWQQQNGWREHGGWQGHPNWQQHRATNWQADHRTWGQRGGYGGYYIPQDRFQRRFGIDHGFRIGQRPVMYMGYPRFRYGGFSFMMVDPYPEYWSEDWYQSDDVYVDYTDDGYYLFNRRYPDAPIAITVVL